MLARVFTLEWLLSHDTCTYFCVVFDKINALGALGAPLATKPRSPEQLGGLGKGAKIKMITLFQKASRMQVEGAASLRDKLVCETSLEKEPDKSRPRDPPRSKVVSLS